MITLLSKRRSIRKYAKKAIPAATVRRLKEALLRSPSSRDLRPWHIIVVDDIALLKQLSGSKAHGSAFLAEAPLGIVVCGDEKVSDVWIEDCSIASILLQMTALDLGLGSCWIQIRNRKTADGSWSEEVVRKVAGVPGNLRVLSIIAIGYPAERKKGIAVNRLPKKRISHNRFGKN
ncbi:MAG: nitroreductase family protein [Chitinispirillaceae bacterium]|nr:nitroreductase family protein [Chitinispirillaceae bacterium]